MTREQQIAALVRMGVSREAAEARIPREPIVLTPTEQAARLNRLEKFEQRDIKKLWLTLGGRVWETSQTRAAKVTPGIPDLYLTHAAWKCAMWFESKSLEEMKTRNSGRSPEQMDFAADAIAAGVCYGYGTYADFVCALLDSLPQSMPPSRESWRDAVYAAIDKAGLTFSPPVP